MFYSFALFLCFACSGTGEKSEHISQKTAVLGKKDKTKELSIQQELPTALVTAITDWDDLKTLQEELSLAKLLPFSEQFETDDHLSNATLFEKHQGYRLLVQHLSERVESLTRDMERFDCGKTRGITISCRECRTKIRYAMVSSPRWFLSAGWSCKSSREARFLCRKRLW